MTNSSTPLSRDESTRYLCAAPHLDPDFANTAIREFLVESTRAVAPSPGVDSGAVLREAVAARSRRRTRDSLLTTLLMVFAICAPAFTVGWIIVALAASAGRLAKGNSPKRDPLRSTRIVAAVVVIGFLLASAGLLTDLFPRSDVVVIGVLSTVMFAGMATVLLVDRLAVWALLTRSFRRGRFEVNPNVGNRWPGEWQVRRFGHRYLSFEPPNVHVDAAEKRPETIVYRGYHPFVGTGLIYKPWSLTVPLEPDDERSTPKTFTLKDLYDALERDLTALSASLSPSNRLRGLVTFERVVVPVDDLLVRVSDPATATILPDHLGRPLQHLPDDVVERIAEEPPEWMRYYRCFQVETWDRELVVSAYLHLGSDQRNLYVEWTPCVLLPVRDEYREFDQLRTNSWRPVAQAFAKLARLPVTILGRFLHAVTPIRPIPEEPGLLLPVKYGALLSLRELAAGTEDEDYFQRTDLERYVKVLESRLTRSLGEFLEDKGIAVTEFMAQVQQVTTKNIHIEGSVTGNVFLGNHNKSGDVTKT